MGGERHIPFLVFGVMALIGSGIVNDRGAANTGTALAIVGIFMFVCNAAIFWKATRR